MTKTPLIAFRCPAELRKKLDADAVKKGQSVSEIILRALSKKYKIDYKAPSNGRPKKTDTHK